MNAAIELHDSTLVAIEPAGSDLVVILSPVYVHESRGTPGVHSGVGFWQDARLRLRGASPVVLPRNLPVRISDGSLAAGAQRWANVVPVPLDVTADCRLWLQLCDGSGCDLRAVGIAVELFGTPTSHKSFSGA
jgi:hypothetical protein